MILHRWLVFALLFSAMGSSLAAPDYQADITDLDFQIGQAQRQSDAGSGLIHDVATLRLEILKLSKALLENRRLADSGIGVEIIQVPETPINQSKVDDILADITVTLKNIEVAERESAEGGGLMLALALTRVETEKLSLAQLKLAYFQARYGIVFPSVRATAVETSDKPRPIEPPIEESIVQVEWADPRYPHIDYSLTPFRELYQSGVEISGWWSIDSDKAQVDDSLKISAANFSQFTKTTISDVVVFLIRCNEGVTSAVYLPGGYLISDRNRDSLDAVYRIDEQPAKRDQWNKLTNKRGAGLFGREAESFLRTLYNAKKLFVRLTERRGEKHNSLFQLDGITDVIDKVADACGWTTLDLTREDYRAIQTLLNVGGYGAGTPDGLWGRGSRRAMGKFQLNVGLAETGAPNRESLKQLGFTVE